MPLVEELTARAASKCELCSGVELLDGFAVTPSDNTAESVILACKSCREQVEEVDALDMHHWRCLNDAMWSEVPAVQVVAWRMLTRLKYEAWARELLDMMYLDDDRLAWAQQGQQSSGNEQDDDAQHRDSNGSVLAAGDTVNLIKDLPVKGAGFTAKRGTTVRNISLVPDNAEHIEGRVNGQQIVILTKFVKKA